MVVEMPPQDSESETIVLRGSNSDNSLVHALTQVYEKANSVVKDQVSFLTGYFTHGIAAQLSRCKPL